jgi:hypothetical protein
MVIIFAHLLDKRAIHKIAARPQESVRGAEIAAFRHLEHVQIIPEENQAWKLPIFIRPSIG